jgi:hypothetical protein
MRGDRWHTNYWKTARPDRCELCGATATGHPFSARWDGHGQRPVFIFWDHCHEHSIVRGALCHACNTMEEVDHRFRSDPVARRTAYRAVHRMARALQPLPRPRRALRLRHVRSVEDEATFHHVPGPDPHLEPLGLRAGTAIRPAAPIVSDRCSCPCSLQGTPNVRTPVLISKFLKPSGARGLQ